MQDLRRGHLYGADFVTRPRLLDLFCGAGGASMGYHRAGFDVVGIDIKPQPNYPFQFVQANALVALQRGLGGRWGIDGPALSEFDAIHASPPCQAYTTMRVMPNAGTHPDLVEPTREGLIASGLPWVMENVPGAPLEVHAPSLLSPISGVMLCSTMFDLNNGEYESRRHRLFESNVPLVQPACRHRLPVVGFYGDHARTRQRVAGHRDRGGDIVGDAKKLPLVRDLMGIDWMAWHEATQAIPPAYTEFIGEQLMSALPARSDALT